jgi:hypothetical protein
VKTYAYSYATSVTVPELKLPGFYQINKLDPDEEGPGFQRLLNQGRAKKLTDYLLDGHTEGDAFIPTSLFLATNKDIPFDATKIGQHFLTKSQFH